MVGNVTEKHPDYFLYETDWTALRDCEAGMQMVKERGETHLPMPSGFRSQKDGGTAFYNAYKLRAQFPDILKPTLAGMVGVIHRVEAQIEGLEEGKPLEGLWERATKDGLLPLEAFHRRITTELLLMGRFCILTDMASDADRNAIPYLVGYTAEQLINWSEIEKDLFVLDESRKVRLEGNEFAWVDQERYRVLRLGVPKTDEEEENSGNGNVGSSNGRAMPKQYTAQVYVIGGGNKQDEQDPIAPQVQGGDRLTEIPLVVVGPRDISLDLEQPPLLGVANAALAVYRLDADYRHQLYNSGQETLFLIGDIDEIPEYVGAGVTLGLPAGGDAKYVGPSGVGINSHRTAIIDERQNAVAAGVKLFDSERSAESGEALRLRAAAQTATLTTIAQASAAALEKALRFAAMFVGQDPNEIVVKPNLQFVDTKMTPQEATQLVTVWQSGAISKQTLYEDLQKGEIASAERTFEEEQELIDQEAQDQAMAAEAMGMQQPGGPNPSLNGSENLPGAGAGGQVPSRFIEDGTGLVIEKA